MTISRKGPRTAQDRNAFREMRLSIQYVASATSGFIELFRNISQIHTIDLYTTNLYHSIYLKERFSRFVVALPPDMLKVPTEKGVKKNSNLQLT